MKNKNLIKIPKQKEVEQKILESINKGNKSRSKIISTTATALGLTEKEAKDRAPDSKNTKYKSIIGTVLTQLVNNNIVNIHDKDTKKETYSLPNKDNKTNKVKTNKRQHAEHVESFESITKNSNKTYYELIENTTKLKAKYLEELKISLLKCISVCGSEFFEQMCVELVCKIYQVSNEQGKVIGGVNDGGIDGIVTIVDAIGFEIENIYLQCKCRQDLKTNSSAKEVREFIGAMKQEGKGIFFTNGRIHDLAVKAAHDTSIMLIDGQKLASLMINHLLGVKISEDGYPIIDHDFFPITH